MISKMKEFCEISFKNGKHYVQSWRLRTYHDYICYTKLFQQIWTFDAPKYNPYQEIIIRTS